VLRELFSYFIENPEELIPHGASRSRDDVTAVAVADFLAGMTDRFAMKLYEKLFFPQPWKTL